MSAPVVSERGTCPTCKRKYTIKADGCIRRHSGPLQRCFTSNQVPLEIHKAIFVIAEMGSDDGESESDQTDVHSPI